MKMLFVALTYYTVFICLKHSVIITTYLKNIHTAFILLCTLSDVDIFVLKSLFEQPLCFEY